MLPCYRDVDPRGKVDLDAYFLDPQVQGYIKDRDSLPAPRILAHAGEQIRSGANGSCPVYPRQARQTRLKDLALFDPC